VAKKAAQKKQPKPPKLSKVREHSSAVERCGPHVAISPAMLRSSNAPKLSKAEREEQGKAAKARMEAEKQAAAGAGAATVEAAEAAAGAAAGAAVGGGSAAAEYLSTSGVEIDEEALAVLAQHQAVNEREHHIAHVDIPGAPAPVANTIDLDNGARPSREAAWKQAKDMQAKLL